MTEISPIKAHADRQLGSSLSSAIDAPSLNGHGGSGEEDSTIKCICGYSDDDGNTVYCELCNTWQHIECYYPLQDVPEVHECVNCRPRQVDAKAATDRQRQSRLAVSSGERKPKRGPAKRDKKKGRDASTAPLQINGSGSTTTAAEQVLSFDRASGSPRDQPPPTKRPKTSHRTSSSATSITHPHSTISSSRKRAGSAAVAIRSPTKSPSTPMTNGYSGEQQFSPQFMRLYATEFTHSRTNSFSNISVTQDLSTWLDDVDQLLEVTKGKKQGDVFQRWDKPWEELEDISPGVSKHSATDNSITVHGKHPQFVWLTADSDAAAGAFIGEINGQITRIEDYCQDPANRWQTLRHPEPFVFFHDKLPICIDCRQEGSELRYVRRSCQPNARMQVIIVGKEYHFCLVSTELIPQGREITIGWNIDEKPQAIMKNLIDKKSIRPEEENYMASWVSGVLANFGGCPCGRPDGVCFFERFQIRGSQLADSNAMAGLKPTGRSRKSKKSTSQISPLSTGLATNSRAGSEAVNQGENDNDDVDGRSTTGSSRSKPSSRDITPLDASVGLGVELSSREQRKLAQQERLFEQMENDGPRRRKRNSAGSALNTPSATASKQLGFADLIDPSPTSTSGLIKTRINGQSRYIAMSRSGRISTNGSLDASKRSVPSYSEISTQTEPAGSLTSSPSALTALRRARGCSFATKLLRQSRKQRARLNSHASEMVNGTSDAGSPTPTRSDSTATMDQVIEVMMPPPPSLPSQDVAAPKTNGISMSTSVASTSAPAPAPATVPTTVPPSNSDTAVAGDVEMKDVERPMPEPLPKFEIKDLQPSKDKHLEPAESSNAVQNSSHPPLQPPPPSTEASSTSAPVRPPTPTKSPPPSKPLLHVELPVPPVFPNQPPVQFQTPPTSTLSSSTVPEAAHTSTTANANSATNPSNHPASPFAQSPTAMFGNPHLFSPSVASAVTPSPMKKKLSLSDYTSRKKKNEAAAQQAAQAKESSPLNPTGSTGGNATVSEMTTIKEEKPNVTGDSSALSASVPVAGDSNAGSTTAPEPTSTAVDGHTTSVSENAMDIDGAVKKVEVPATTTASTGVGGW